MELNSIKYQAKYFQTLWFCNKYDDVTEELLFEIMRTDKENPESKLMVELTNKQMELPDRIDKKLHPYHSDTAYNKEKKLRYHSFIACDHCIADNKKLFNYKPEGVMCTTTNNNNICN